MEAPTVQDLALECPPLAAWPHSYEAQLIMQHQARLLVLDTLPACQASQAREAEGSCRLPIYPPALPCPLPHPRTDPLPGLALSQGLRPCQAARGGGSADNKGQCHGNGHFPREIFCLASFLH